MTQPLHPNLARLAAAYDEIVERHRQGRISPRQARGEVAALMGRDDSGLVWTINPLNGRWCYRNLRGELVEADPPRFGVPAPTPADLGGGEQGGLDRRVTFFEIDKDPFTLPPLSSPSTRLGPLTLLRRILGR
jgi:hypothetical protein